MRRHGPVIAHCTDLEDFPLCLINVASHICSSYNGKHEVGKLAFDGCVVTSSIVVVVVVVYLHDNNKSVTGMNTSLNLLYANML